MFGFGKKKETKENCCCVGNCISESVIHAEQIKSTGSIKVLGGGCAKCHELVENTKAAMAEIGINETVELITDYSVIAAYGVMSTPVLVVDNKVVSYGKVLNASDIVDALKKAYRE